MSAVCRCNELGAEMQDQWGRFAGPWQSEPNRVDFHHAGFPCILHRGPAGHWCGYVGLPPLHPLYDRHYDDVPVKVHGGLTFGERCDGHICHTPAPGEPDNVYWLGFDCNHPGDQAPVDYWYAITLQQPLREGRYWTVGEVLIETRRLADQLRALA